MSVFQKETPTETDEWEKLAYEFLLEEKNSLFNKSCSACNEDLLSEEMLICKECLEIKSTDFFKWASEYSPIK